MINSHGKGSHQNTWSLVTCSCRRVHFFPRSDDTYSCRADKETELWQGGLSDSDLLQGFPKGCHPCPAGTQSCRPTTKGWNQREGSTWRSFHSGWLVGAFLGYPTAAGQTANTQGSPGWVPSPFPAWVGTCSLCIPGGPCLFFSSSSPSQDFPEYTSLCGPLLHRPW